MDTSPTQLETLLATQDVPCPSCDYNLRGLKGDTCPECSQRLALRVGLLEPRQRAFIAAIVGLAMGAGFHGLLLAFFLIVIFRRSLSGDEGRFLILTAPFFVVEAVSLSLLLRKRRQFQRRSDFFKGWIITAAWTITLVGFALFTALIK